MQGTLQYQLQQGSRYHEVSQQRILKMLREVARSYVIPYGFHTFPFNISLFWLVGIIFDIFSLGYLIMEQNFASASLCRNFSKIDHNSRASWNNIHQELQGGKALARVNYPVKKAPCIIKEQEIFNMEDTVISFALTQG